MMKNIYTVYFSKISEVEVEASSLEEAKEKADPSLCDWSDNNTIAVVEAEVTEHDPDLDPLEIEVSTKEGYTLNHPDLTEEED